MEEYLSDVCPSAVSCIAGGPNVAVSFNLGVLGDFRRRRQQYKNSNAQSKTTALTPPMIPPSAAPERPLPETLVLVAVGDVSGVFVTPAELDVVLTVSLTKERDITVVG